MSKQELKKHLANLNRKQLQDQISDLYDRFRSVKTYFDFAFNPQEDKLAEDAKFKIGKEYFPQSRRKPKMRRSVAQKLIKHFVMLGVDAATTLDIMLFNIETAQAYRAEKFISQLSFYKSMLRSYAEALEHAENHGLTNICYERALRIAENTGIQEWLNAEAFGNTFQKHFQGKY